MVQKLGMKQNTERVMLEGQTSDFFQVTSEVSEGYSRPIGLTLISDFH